MILMRDIPDRGFTLDSSVMEDRLIAGCDCGAPLCDEGEHDASCPFTALSGQVIA